MAKGFYDPQKDWHESPIVNLEIDRVIKIETAEFVEVTTLEKLTLPLTICGRIGLRSYYSRKGLVLFSGPQIDPGFDGCLIISLFNTGPREIILKYGDPFCTVEFNRLDKPAEKGYSGPYQHQDDFPSDNIEFITGAMGITLYEVVETMKDLRSDIRWIKVLLGFILAALIAGIITRI